MSEQQQLAQRTLPANSAFAILHGAGNEQLMAEVFDFSHFREVLDSQAMVELMAMRHASGVNLSQLGGKTLKVVDMIVHEWESEKDDGEIVKALRWILKLEDGSIVHNSGKAVSATLFSAAAYNKFSPWSPAIELSIVVKDLGNGKRMTTIIWEPFKVQKGKKS